MYSTGVLAFLAVLLKLALSFSWDIVVGGEKRLVFFYNGTVTHTEDIPLAHLISSVTYDPVHFRVLYVDHHNTNMSIHSFDLTTKKMQTLVMSITSTNFPFDKNLAYDPVTQILFWTEEKKIYSLLLKPASSNKPVDGDLLVTSEYYSGDIDVDSCGGYIYWVTDYNIERAAFDGSKREVLINRDVFWRRSLVLDQQTKTMYWIEETTASHHCIESADFNGKNRRTFYHIGYESLADALIVSIDFIYWRSYNQRAILKLPKHQQHGVAPVVYSQSTRNCRSCQLTAAYYTIAEQTLGIKSCEAQKSVTLDVEEHHGSVCHNYCFQGNCTVSAEGHPKCSCEAGFSGKRCEVNACYMYCLNGGVCSVNEAKKPVCKDYCLQGNCSVTTEKQPTCRCNAGYSGERCEVNACHEHCLNNGDCSLNKEDEPICQCTADYDGERCEVSVCQDNCVRAEGKPHSRCNASYSGNRYEQNPCRGFCLNNGVCSLHEGDEPVCRCSADYGGDRCELPAVLIKCIQTVSMLREMLSTDITSVNQGKGVKSKFAASVV